MVNKCGHDQEAMSMAGMCTHTHYTDVEGCILPPKTTTDIDHSIKSGNAKENKIAIGKCMEKISSIIKTQIMKINVCLYHEQSSGCSC